ncbi:low affinity iron permease family protein [Parachlamydia acanthamoebae]|nr:low affinity iron permease family protein [Parachlamydia acanthamoebae]
MAGKPLTFVVALTFVLVWVIVGLIWGFSNTWLLVIDTIATINASLMVFIIQNTQNRESKALHLKIDGLIKSIKEAENELIAVEKLGEEELDQIRKKIFI